MTVEVLYFEGCPNHQPAVERVRDVLRDEGISDQVTEIEVPDTHTAEQVGFVGSPSIRINGVDVEQSADELKSFGLMCRTYRDGCCHSGVPSAELIRQAIRHQTARSQHA